MTRQIIIHNTQRILTTQQLAEAYEVEAQLITNNFNRNKEHYVLGKHYYYLEGEELEQFKTTTQFDLLTNKINKLYLWTEKGALLHAKSLNTEKAWAVYEQLVDDYYQLKDQPQQPTLTPEQYARELRLAKAKAQKAKAEQKVLEAQFAQDYPDLKKLPKAPTTPKLPKEPRAPKPPLTDEEYEAMLLEWLRKRDEPVTIRDIHQYGPGRVQRRNAAQIRMYITHLQDQGLLKSVQHRKCTRYQLREEDN